MLHPPGLAPGFSIEPGARPVLIAVGVCGAGFEEGAEEGDVPVPEDDDVEACIEFEFGLESLDDACCCRDGGDMLREILRAPAPSARSGDKAFFALFGELTGVTSSCFNVSWSRSGSISSTGRLLGDVGNGGRWRFGLAEMLGGMLPNVLSTPA